MQFGVDGHKLSSPPDVIPMFEGLGAAPMLNRAPRTVKLTLLRIISLHDSICLRKLLKNAVK
jgi:hypothetical protein